MKKIGKEILKIIITTALFYYLFKNKVPANEVIQNIENINPLHLILIITLFFLYYLIFSLRWKFLLRAQEINITPGRSYLYILVSFFFNNFLPSGLGMDMIRSAYAGGREHFEKALGASIMERILGMMGMMRGRGMMGAGRMNMGKRGGRMGRMGRGPQRGRMMDHTGVLIRLADKLDLSEEQKAELKDLATSHRKDMIKMKHGVSSNQWRDFFFLQGFVKVFDPVVVVVTVKNNKSFLLQHFHRIGIRAQYFAHGFIVDNVFDFDGKLITVVSKFDTINFFFVKAR